MSARLDQVIASAIAQGILPPGTLRPSDEQRPWPVILLTALGAWLAALPLLYSISAAFHGALLRGAAPYLLGTLMLVATTILLRRDQLPLFLEQFSLPALLVGGGMLAYGLDHDLGSRTAQLAMAIVALAIACLVRRSWLRVLLGGAACVCVVLSLQARNYTDESFRWWLASYLALGAWVALQWLGRDRLANARRALMLEWIGLGWILVTLASLAVWAGMTFMAGASLGGGGGQGNLMPQPWDSIARLCSTAVALGAATWLAWRWPALRQWWSALAALVLVGLAWLMPTLGAALWVLSVFCTGQRWRLAMAAGVAAVWIIGALYYQLSFPLGTKALMLLGAGALLAAISWSALRGQAMPFGGAAASNAPFATRLGISVCAFAVLAVANVGIWQKETVIAEGRPVFVELVPVDPRSLMQGDYMRLGFRLPQDQLRKYAKMPGASRLRAVGKIDARGILTLDHLDTGAPLAPDEMAIELTPNDRRWTLVTDAWYFKEGDAARWARARYGEFRVDAKGRSLLVNLRGPALEPL
ncbi:MAG: GDYXXLXY domain-containing protein [Pseudomonadota bacterium]